MGATQAPPGLTIISPRETVSGGSGEALSDLIVDKLPNGALCLVTTEQALYRLDKYSNAEPDGARVVVTGRGASARGRWVQTSGATSMVPMQTLVWCDANFVGMSTGSIAAPFTTLQEAIDFLPEEGGSVLMAPGEYDGEWEIPDGHVINIIGVAGPQGATDGNIEIGAGSIGDGAGVRLENIALGGHITVSGHGGLYCSNVSFYIHDIIQSGDGGWNVRIVSDGLDTSDVGNVTCNLLVAQNVTLQRPIIVRGNVAKLLTTTAQGNITFEGQPGQLLTDLFSLNAMRGENAQVINASAVIAVDVPTAQFTITSPAFGAAGTQFVEVDLEGALPGDTFAVSNLTSLPANVFLGQARCTTADHCLICLGAFGAALSGDVTVAITRFAGGA